MSTPNDMFKSVMIIKKNNLVDLSKFYFTLHEPSSLHSQKSRELQNKEQGCSFYRRKQSGNKEIVFGFSWLAGAAYLTLFRTGNHYRFLAINQGLACWIYCISGKAEHLQKCELSKFQFADVSLNQSLEMYFN